MYDKNVNRKSKVHFNPRQTLEYLKSDTANVEISFQTKRNIVKQYLDVSIVTTVSPDYGAKWDAFGDRRTSQ